ncbi:phenylalanine--tRNA ligase subunit beta [Collinsella sp. zg1085]|uniref:phenylalanine--tRNA ligase subunit beta n=1 Tax=Collinsella sp. zg1085 TaxID=2844380 RepID=UPI001C0B5D65|nr:phenylalanine--tRNA ligase subunit beta [Collinsella sp. zg1085]QWT17744.1 phenylalanine--tRNA ligase subunit beta [Collinsella sp. zg1085]
MRVSYDWLKTLVDVPADPHDLVREFVRTGTEVEAVDVVGEQFDHIVTAQVVSKVAHPDSDHMWLCQVDVGEHHLNTEGEPTPLQIVCGAQNFNEGDHIVTALVGAELPGGVLIKKSKLRGQVSEGMNCSARELGLSTDHEGIMILPADAPVGMPFAEYLGTSDTVLDCEITPNRPDCLSMVGIAREVGAIFDCDTHIEMPTIATEQGAPTADELSVEITDAALCRRYVARIIRGVKVAPSPEWLVQRLAALKIRPHNNIVDITNYVMMLTGQPLHAFDLASFSEQAGKRRVYVRAAHEGERFVTLDGVERELAEGMALITDGVRPVALAGVMGGADSEISDTTVDVLLESACFDAGRTSHTSRNLSLISDASIRFERQVDERGCVDVANIACALIEQLAEGQVAPGYVDVYPAPCTLPELELRLPRVKAICGVEIPVAFVVRALTRLGCTVVEGNERLEVTPPSYRPDLVREIDLIEEIIRLWGMDRVPAQVPAAKNHIGGLTAEQHTLRMMGRLLRSCGLNEATSFSFAAPGDLERLGMSADGRGCAVEIMNPLVAEQTELRRSLMPGLLQSVAYNNAHGTQQVMLYEIGELFWGREHKSLPRELRSVAGVFSGTAALDTWNQHHHELRFFDAKGVVEELLTQLRIPKPRFVVATGEQYSFLQPGRAAEVQSGSSVLGWVGEIHPNALRAFDIDTPVAAFELNVELLLRLAQAQEQYREYSSFPSVDIDLALVVDEDVSYADILQRLHAAGGNLLADARLFDVYRDPVRVGKNKKSMAFALTYRAADHTLTSEEVERAHQKLVTKVCRAVNGEVRS